jgi:hypothetical protein
MKSTPSERGAWRSAARRERVRPGAVRRRGSPHLWPGNGGSHRRRPQAAQGNRRLMIAASAIAEDLPLFTTSPADFAGLDALIRTIPGRLPCRPARAVARPLTEAPGTNAKTRQHTRPSAGEPGQETKARRENCTGVSPRNRRNRSSYRKPLTAKPPCPACA